MKSFRKCKVTLAVWFFSFSSVDCRVSRQSRLRKRDVKSLQVESARTDSAHGVPANNATVSLKAACSFSGEPWDPLHDCFYDGTRVNASVVRNHLLCRMKKELASQATYAWTHASFVGVDDASSKDKREEKDSENSGRNDRNSSKDVERFFRSCAIISNSGVLRMHNHGQAIDSANMVMRFNDAPIKGWTNYVGGRDDMRIVNAKFPERVFYKSLKTYEFKASTVFGVVHDTTIIPSLDAFRERYPSTSIRVLDPGLMKSVELFLQSAYDAHWFNGQGVSFTPTTGAIGMLLALTQCDEVRAYGMAATPVATHVPYHYYKEDEGVYRPQDADENSWHKSFSAEKDLWRKIARNTGDDIDKSDIAVIPGFSQISCY